MLQITVVQNILPENYDGVSSMCDTGQLNRTNGTYDQLLSIHQSDYKQKLF